MRIRITIRFMFMIWCMVAHGNVGADDQLIPLNSDVERIGRHALTVRFPNASLENIKLKAMTFHYETNTTFDAPYARMLFQSDDPTVRPDVPGFEIPPYDEIYVTIDKTGKVLEVYAVSGKSEQDQRSSVAALDKTDILIVPEDVISNDSLFSFSCEDAPLRSALEMYANLSGNSVRVAGNIEVKVTGSSHGAVKRAKAVNMLERLLTAYGILFHETGDEMVQVEQVAKESLPGHATGRVLEKSKLED